MKDWRVWELSLLQKMRSLPVREFVNGPDFKGISEGLPDFTHGEEDNSGRSNDFYDFMMTQKLMIKVRQGLLTVKMRKIGG